MFGFRRGDTDYRLSLLPLGGYVKMSGESPGEASTGDPGGVQFAHPRWQRILIGLAGPVSNFLLALLLMTGFYMMHNEVEAFRSQTAEHRLRLLTTAPPSNAGLKSGDRDYPLR